MPEVRGSAVPRRSGSQTHAMRVRASSTDARAKAYKISCTFACAASARCIHVLKACTILYACRCSRAGAADIDAMPMAPYWLILVAALRTVSTHQRLYNTSLALSSRIVRHFTSRVQLTTRKRSFAVAFHYVLLVGAMSAVPAASGLCSADADSYFINIISINKVLYFDTSNVSSVHR